MSGGPKRLANGLTAEQDAAFDRLAQAIADDTVSTPPEVTQP